MPMHHDLEENCNVFLVLQLNQPLQMYASLSVEEKAFWQHKADLDKARYLDEMSRLESFPFSVILTIEIEIDHRPCKLLPKDMSHLWVSMKKVKPSYLQIPSIN